jgi:HK97 gp10 family phage protein
MAEFSSNITGVKELTEAFSALPEITAKKAIRPSLRKAGNLIKKQVQINLSGLGLKEPTGFLEKNIITKAGKTKSKSDIRQVVAIRGKVVNPKNGQRPGLYGSVLEFGKEGQPAKPYFRPAIREKSQEAFNQISEFVKSKMDECVNEARR